MKITYRLLVKGGACETGRNEFKKHFPNGMQPTVENLSHIVALELDVFWGTELLSEKDYLAYTQACEDNNLQIHYCTCPFCLHNSSFYAEDASHALAILSSFLLNA